MSFLRKLFGGKKQEGGDVEDLVYDALGGLIERGGFDLDFELNSKSDEKGEPVLTIELSGPDEGMVKENDGQVIDAFQLFIQRAIQHNFPEDRTKIAIDCGGFLQENSQALVDLAEKLKDAALEKGRPVYFRALPPKDRKIVHQYLANDVRIKSRSVGEGLFKKIKIYPVKDKDGDADTDTSTDSD